MCDSFKKVVRCWYEQDMGHGEGTMTTYIDIPLDAFLIKDINKGVKFQEDREDSLRKEAEKEYKEQQERRIVESENKEKAREYRIYLKVRRDLKSNKKKARIRDYKGKG